MPSTRYTVRLPPPLDAAVQEHLRTAGTPFAVLIRQALAAYLADTPPTGVLTSADTAHRLQTLEAQLAELTTRVQVIEEILTQGPQSADTSADRSADRDADMLPTSADTSADISLTGADTPPRRPGRQPGLLRQRVLALLQAHPEGLRAEELRVYLRIQRPIGDTLQGMQRAGLIQGHGRGLQRRYQLPGGT